jgi:hypothetical protein
VSTLPTPKVLWSFEQWLDELIDATPDERRMLAIEGSDAGMALRRVRDVRCDLDLNWLSAFSHLDHSESSYRFQNGSHAQLHHRGDLQPARPPADQCGLCRAPIIWTTTQAGTSLPVDADPDTTAGSVLLTAPIDGSGRPVAVWLRTDAERLAAPADSVHTPHRSTCGRTTGRRRPKGHR